MPVTRKLTEISVQFSGSNTPTVIVSASVADDSEGTATGIQREMAQQAIMNAAVSLRDAVMQIATNQSKPLTF